jgi:hypothetical protein
LYLGAFVPRALGQNVKNTSDLQADRVLYLGATRPANTLNFPSNDRVLYLGVCMFLSCSAFLPLPVIFGYFLRILGPPSPLASRMIGSPFLGVFITATVNVLVFFSRPPNSVGLVMALFLAGFLETGFLTVTNAGVWKKLLAAIQASSFFRHASTSSGFFIPGTRVNADWVPVGDVCGIERLVGLVLFFSVSPMGSQD